jgi:hypothetical protein
LLLLLLLLLLRSITARRRRVGALRIRELAHLLLLLSQRDLVAGILLLILEQQLARKLLVQLGLFGLYRVCRRVRVNWLVLGDRNEGV